jgi:hypothetical protein
MVNAVLDARQEGDYYRRVEVITGERRRRRWTGEEARALQEAARAQNVELSIYRVTRAEEILATIDRAQASGAT